MRWIVKSSKRGGKGREGEGRGGDGSGGKGREGKGRGHFKELAHTTVEAGKSVCRLGQQAEEMVLQFKSKGNLLAELFLGQWMSVFSIKNFN